MVKLNLLIANLLLLVATMGFWQADLLTQNSVAQSSTQKQQMPWENLYQRKPPPRQDPPGGSRGEICAIAPSVSREMGVIWSDRPLFLWQGNVTKIEVRPRESQQALWSHTVDETVKSAMYSGKALQPGQSYRFVMLDEDSTVLFALVFQVMDGEGRSRISSDLTRLEAQLKQKGATAEEIAYAKADYFASRQMWADALREAYSVENASSALSQFKQSIPDQFCPR